MAQLCTPRVPPPCPGCERHAGSARLVEAHAPDAVSAAMAMAGVQAKLRVHVVLRWRGVAWLQADKIQALYPAAERVSLQAGHCPHDDTPAQANEALLAWLNKLQ